MPAELLRLSRGALAQHDVHQGGAAVAERMEFAFLWRPIFPDADDDMVLETAINGRADGIVTFNRRDFAPAESRFGLGILSPGETVSRMQRSR